MEHGLLEQTDSSRVRRHIQAIIRNSDGFFKAFNEKNLDSYMAFMPDDVVWMGLAGPLAIVRKDAVRSNHDEFFERGPFTPALTSSNDEVIVSGDWAFDRGTWTIIRNYHQGVRRERLESCYVLIMHRAVSLEIEKPRGFHKANFLKQSPR